jgi:hypothetical protein
MTVVLASRFALDAYKSSSLAVGRKTDKIETFFGMFFLLVTLGVLKLISG